MPGNSTFRTKLIGLTLVPTVALAGVTALAVRPRLADASNASKDLLTIDAVQRSTNYLVELGEERQISVRYLLAKKSATGEELKALVAKNTPIGRELEAQRVRTDAATSAFKEAVNQLPEERRTSTVPDAYKTVENLATIRRSIDNLNQAPAYTLGSFNSEADTLLDFYHDATDASSQSQQIRDGASLANLTVTRELWARGRDLLTISLQTKTFDAKALSQFVALNDQADRSRRTFNATASPRLVEKVAADLKVPAVSATQDLVIAAINAGQQGAVPNVNAETWFKGSSGRVKVLTDTVGPLFANLRERAASAENQARSAALLFVILGLVAIGLALGFSIILGRSLVRRLASVSAQAKEIAEQRLPEVLHILRTPSAEALATAMPEVRAGVNDEVGQIANSFNTVLRTAVRTSLEHANKRAKTMNDMLVNLGRRNQALIDRQLELIDKLEATQRDPDVLESLFKLDHMVTRMRRNAENLLVLAAEQGARPWTQSVTVAEILQAATSETADMNRVQLELTPADNRPIPGRIAVDFSHLVAELVENALSYSPPIHPVLVKTEHSASGLRIWILDQGVGMSDAELAEANERIENPPDIDELTTDQIGFQVVGRLGNRLGMNVRLQANPGRGLAVAISAPASALEAEMTPTASGLAAAMGSHSRADSMAESKKEAKQMAPTSAPGSPISQAAPISAMSAPVGQSTISALRDTPALRDAAPARPAAARPTADGPLPTRGAKPSIEQPQRREEAASRPTLAPPAARPAAPAAPPVPEPAALKERRPKLEAPTTPSVPAAAVTPPAAPLPITVEAIASIALRPDRDTALVQPAPTTTPVATAPTETPAFTEPTGEAEPAEEPIARTANGLAKRNTNNKSFATATAAAAAAAGEFRRLPVPGENGTAADGSDLSFDAFERSRRLAELRAGVDKGRIDDPTTT